MKSLILAFVLLASTSAQQLARRPAPVRNRIAVNACDVNADGAVTVADLQIVIDEALGYLPFTPLADVNRDGVVNVVDFQIVLNADLGYGCEVSR